MNYIRTSILFSIVAIATLVSCSSPSYDVEVWSGDADINWNESRFQRIETELLDSLRPGDEIVINFDYIGNDEWPIITLFDDNWGTMAGVGRIAITEDMTEASFYATQQMADSIKAKGLLVSGIGFRMRRVGIRHHETPDGLATLAWLGNTPMKDQQSFQDFSSRTFRDLVEGDVLRFTFSDIKDTVQFILYTGQWMPISSSHIVTHSDTIFECVADKDLISKATREGLRISGKGSNIRRLDIIKPIWQGEEHIDWFRPEFITCDSLAFKDIRVGDYIVVSIDYTGEGDFPQVALLDDEWGGIDGAGKIRINQHDSSVTFCVTQPMYETLRKRGAVVTGIGYNIKAVSIIHGRTFPGMETASWIGEIKMNVAWSAFQLFPAATFSNVEPGDVMRVSVTDVYDGARITLRSGEWNYIDGVVVSSMEPNEKSFDFVFTPEILKAIKKDEGLVVFGTNYTLNMMHLIKSER